MIDVEVDGRHYGFVFVCSEGISRKNFSEKDFLSEVVRLHRKNGRKTKVSGDDYIGEVERGEFSIKIFKLILWAYL